MSTPRIAIIISSTRTARFGDKPAHWIYEQASARPDMEVELLDLRDFPLPFFDEVASNAWAPSRSEVARRWQQTIARFDGFIFIVAEYNRTITAALKNALDYAYPEWNRKAAAFVGYGMVGGARAVEHLRQVSVELQMAPTRNGVHLQGADFLAAWQEGKPLSEFPYLAQSAATLLDELVWWSTALKTAREQQA